MKRSVLLSAFALAVMAAGASPGFAAAVVPISGSVTSGVESAHRDASEHQTETVDIDTANWVTTPTALSATSVAFLFPPSSGTIGTSNTMSADWSNSGLSGAFSIVSQVLVTELDAYDSGGFAGTDPPASWTYAFHATTDAVFDLLLVDHGYSDAGDANITHESGGVLLDVNGVTTGLDAGPSSFALAAGQDYVISLFAHSGVHANSGSAVVNYSGTVDWNIIDPTTDPGGGGGGGSPTPEPAAWAMMLVGFGLAGAGLRSARRRQMQVSCDSPSKSPWPSA